MKPFTPDPASIERRRQRTIILLAVITFCFFYGLTFAFFAPSLVVVIALPIAVLGALVVWALPAVRTAPIHTLEFFFFALFLVSTIWPPYLAVSIAGLPWITIARLTSAPLLAIFLLCLSTSDTFRTRLGSTLNAAPWIWRTLTALIVIEFLSIFLSIDKGLSIDHFLTAQLSWTMIFFISCYIFSMPGRAKRWAGLIWGVSIPICVIGFFEHKVGHVLWAKNIPDFLQINDPAVLEALTGFVREGAHRVQSVFMGSMQLGEYIAYTLPFVIWFLIYSDRAYVKIAALASVILIMYTAFISHARSGMVGVAICLACYGVYRVVNQWKRNPQSLVNSFFIYPYPIVCGLAMVAILAIGRLKKLIIGGGAESSSTLARVAQWKLGLPMVISHPFGHGLATGAMALDWSPPGGHPSIDSYYLSILLELGVIGFIVYYAIFVLGAVLAFRESLQSAEKNHETSLVEPIGAALVSFIVIKSVFSETDNHYIIFALLGMLVALVSRRKGMVAARTAPPVRDASRVMRAPDRS
jgi:hypothetical protein